MRILIISGKRQGQSIAQRLLARDEYRMMFRSILQRRSRPAEKPPAKDQASGDPAPSRGGGDPFNPAFPGAFESFLDGGREMLLVFSGADRISWEFEELFAGRYEAMLDRHRSRIDRQVIEGANHIMSFPEWQDEMLRIVDRWLEERFSG